MEKEKHPPVIKLFYSLYFYSFFIQTLIVFTVVVLLTVGESFFKGELAPGVTAGIIKQSFILSFVYTFVYRLLKSVYVYIRKMISDIVFYDATIPLSALGLATDIFLTLALILTTGPLKPTLRFDQAIPLTGSIIITSDTLATFFILCFVALPAIIMKIKSKKSISKYLFILLIVALIVLAALVNNKNHPLTNLYTKTSGAITEGFERRGLDIKHALKGPAEAKAVIYYWFGISEIKFNNRQQGNAYLLKSIELNPAYGPPYSALSLSYSYFEEWDAAMIFAERCIDYNPDYAGCYFALGKSYDLTGKKDEAYKFFRKAAEMDPQTAEYQSTLREFMNRNPQFQDTTS